MRNFFLSFCLFWTASLHAAPLKHIIVAPHCLLKNVNTSSFHLLETKDSLALIQTDEKGLDVLIKSNQKNRKCCGFMDVTQAFIESHPKTLATSDDASSFLSRYLPQSVSGQASSEYRIQYPDTVNQLIRALNPDNMWRDLTSLSA